MKLSITYEGHLMEIPPGHGAIKLKPEEVVVTLEDVKNISLSHGLLSFYQQGYRKEFRLDTIISVKISEE